MIIHLSQIAACVVAGKSRSVLPLLLQQQPPAQAKHRQILDLQKQEMARVREARGRSEAGPARMQPLHPLTVVLLLLMALRILAGPCGEKAMSST